MNATISCERVHLTDHRSRILENAAGVEISGLNGEVWVTQYGDSRDFMIRPGERLLLSQPGSAVLGARTTAEVLVVRREPLTRRSASLWQRLARLFDPRWSGAARRSMKRGRSGFC